MMATPATLYRLLPTLGQRPRRIAVIATFAGYPLLQLGYVLLRAPDRIPALVWAPIAIGLFAATLIGMVAVYGYGQGRMGRERALDERQRAMVDKALVVSYGVVTALLTAALGVLAVWLSFNGPITLGMADLVPFLIGIGIYVPVLPFAALAWIEPNAPADDEA
jgi:hypothetical protein